MTNPKNGTPKLAKLLATVGIAGSLCGALILYTLDFHHLLRTGGEVLVALGRRLVATPGAVDEVSLLATGMLLLVASSALLAAGVAILLEGRSVSAVERAGAQAAVRDTHHAPATAADAR